MTKNNSNTTITRPEPFKFSMPTTIKDLYAESSQKNILFSENGDSFPDSQGTNGDICIGVKIKGKNVLGIHSGQRWNQCFLYTSGEILELNSKIRELENKIVNLERKSRKDRS